MDGLMAVLPPTGDLSLHKSGSNLISCQLLAMGCLNLGLSM